MKSAFFTGHRTIPLSVTPGIEQLVAIANKQGVEHFYIGMALGTDQLTAQILSKMQLPWTAVVPCRDQDKFWSQSQKQKYHHILSLAPDKIYLADKYYTGCLNQRNLWMINNSQLCLSVWDGRQHGGTFHAVNQARRKNLTIINFHPQKHLIEPVLIQLSLF
ncbi:SLOG family protein [Laspinema olomoucense]|uniref:SLOG family protein n=1 Tax=Laspinema olomoucense D3b TaxID=2953688 RepID=A0ABT2N4R9_9CYAN|nr:SLOG family protein [Laspinema sp. D3b]MCT7977677.1 SLOG family protein [Laspinema sp. D3b]